MKLPLPEWINLFLAAAAIFAAAAVFAALILGWRQGHVAPVADVTINLGGQPVREHCTTCHLQGERPGSGRPHPDIAPHSWSTLGCTGCHLGEGMALDERISHGLPGRGARKVLTGRDLQASCYTCHEPAPLPGAEKAWEGYVLFRQNACDTCHSLSASEPGGRYGPSLEETGSYLGLGQLQEAIRDPKKEPVNSIMPRFPLSSGQTRSIAWFLKSRVRNPFYATPMEIEAGLLPLPFIEPEIPEGLAAEGELLATRKCLACHRFGEEDGRLAPDLTWIGSMRNPDYLRDFLENPARRVPGAIMPQVPMTGGEKDRLIGFLGRQATGPVFPEPADGFAADPAPGSSAGSGARHLYMALCQRCHAADGNGHGLIQPNLAHFPRAFADNPGFFRRADDQRLVRSIEQGVPGTGMPPYSRLLEAERIDALLDLVFAAFIGIPRNQKIESAPLPEAAEPVAPETADAVYARNCQRCHGRFGTGKGVEHLQHLPRPRNLTNRPYFAPLEDGRIARAIAGGIPGTAMPDFRDRLRPAEIWGLVDKVRRFSGEMDERTTQPRTPAVAP